MFYLAYSDVRGEYEWGVRFSLVTEKSWDSGVLECFCSEEQSEL